MDPKGSLSSEVPAAAITSANKEVQTASETVRDGRIRGAYNRYNLLRLPDVAIHVKTANAEIPRVSSIFSK